MKQKSTYHNLFLAAWHIPLAMLLAMFAFTSYSSTTCQYNKPLYQNELVTANRVGNKSGQLTYSKALIAAKSNTFYKPNNWKKRVIRYNQQLIAQHVAYMAYRLTITPKDNFHLPKVIPNNSKDEPPVFLLG